MMRIVIASLSLLITGCCGIGTGPSKHQVQRWLNSSKGRTVSDIDRVFREYGFSVEYDDHAMRARKTSACISVEEGIMVSVRLDDLNRILDGDVTEFRIPP